MIITKKSQNERMNGKSTLKSAVLLTIGVFLLSAPPPDASLVSDITENLIVATESPASEAPYGLDSNS